MAEEYTPLSRGHCQERYFRGWRSRPVPNKFRLKKVLEWQYDSVGHRLPYGGLASNTLTPWVNIPVGGIPLKGDLPSQGLI